MTATRVVYQSEALAWMQAQGPLLRANVMTSLPDVSEIPDLGFDGWMHWFGQAAQRVFEFAHEDALVIFYQSDVRHGGRWVDKGHLVTQAAERTGHVMWWHKIVCRKPPGTITYERAAYSHMLCFGRRAPRAITKPGPDVIVESVRMPWPQAMGILACHTACRFLVENSAIDTVVDPFCGYGTALAVANAMGLHAVGVDLSAKRCRVAREVVLRDGELYRPRRVRDGSEDGGA